jgi:hypothetical protein
MRSVHSLHGATAAFEVVLHPATGVAALAKTFADNARARDALTGKKMKRALSDPDSNSVVPSSVRRFGGDFVLAAQADQQPVFAQNLGMPAVHGNFAAGQAFGSLDTVGTSTDNTQVVRLNVKTGELTPFLTGLTKAKGLAWLP